MCLVFFFYKKKFYSFISIQLHFTSLNLKFVSLSELWSVVGMTSEADGLEYLCFLAHD